MTCEIGFWNGQQNADNQAACVPCPPHSTTTGTASSSLQHCTCVPGYFNPAQSNLTGTPAPATCVACPLGSICDDLGATLASLPIKSGYYRASASASNVVRCSDAASGCGIQTECVNATSACRGGPDTALACQPGLHGIL